MSDLIVETSRFAIEKGSESFAQASRLFPQGIREDAWMLYAWCRHCDDEIDGQDMGRGAVGIDTALAARRLRHLREQTLAALAGDTSVATPFAGLAQVALRHGIPSREPLDLLAGFEMDVSGHRYDTLDDTLKYAWHVAGVIGVMMARVMGVRSVETLRRAQDLGLAFQLTNIARDIVEDARGGRVYLPGAWLAEAGVPQDGVTQPAHRAAVARVAARLVSSADPFYYSARWGLRGLDLRSAWAIATARGVYRRIGRKAVQRGAQAWDDRTVVPKQEKLALTAQGALVALRSHTLDAYRAVPPRGNLWTAF